MTRHLLSCLAALTLAAATTSRCGASPTDGLTLYSIGNPSGDETETLCLLNRARANPPAEGQWLTSGPAANYPSSGIGSISELRTSFSSYPPRPPLAFNAKLNASAKAHTADMMAMRSVQHNSSDGTPFGYRIVSFGYEYPHGENCSGSPSNPDDLGPKLPPSATEGGYEADNYNVEAGSIGHRLTIMEPTNVASVEIGVASSPNGIWNTEDFGANPTPPLLMGVVFTDNAGTGFYAGGEGVGGVTVTAPGASSFYAVTTPSGAYTLPLDLVPVYQRAPYLDTTGQYPVYVQPSPTTAPPPTVQVVFTDAAGNATTKTVTLTHTVGADGGSTYCDAANNVRYDNAEADLVEPGSGHPAFFAGEAALSQGVYYLSFPGNNNVFGYYAYLPQAGFLYHFDLGYEYVIDAKDSQNGVFLYDFASGGWFYTSPGFGFPYLYDFSLNSVVYYYPDPRHAGRYNTDGIRYFYVFGSGKIIAK